MKPHITTDEAELMLRTFQALSEAVRESSPFLAGRADEHAKTLQKRIDIAKRRPHNEIHRQFVEFPAEGVGMITGLVSVEVDVRGLLQKYARRAVLNKSRRSVLGGGRVIIRANSE